MNRIRYFLLLLMICLLVGSCSTTPPPLLEEDLDVTDDENRLWQRAAEEQAIFESSGIIYRDPALEDYLHQIANKLQPLEVREKYNFRIRLIKDPYLNAFAFPNGVIYLHTGILSRLDNEAQLAALLAHEMTHCTHRHALRAFSGLKNQNSLILSLKQTVARIASTGDLLDLFGTTASMAAINGYAQHFETEADMVGLKLMAEAGYDPGEALRLFEHLKEELASENLKEPFFFATHPQLQKRIENCKGFLDTLNSPETQGIKNKEVFLDRIQRVLLYNSSLDLKAGRFRAARRGVEKYLTLRKDDPKAYFLVGEILRERGEAEDDLRAKDFYEKAIALDPSYPDPHKAIGLIYFKEGEWVLAKRSFESSLALSPHMHDRAYVQGYLQECNKRGISP
ncbi:MAG: M48 family metalloprotease [Desulfobacteraceae bacterium]